MPKERTHSRRAASKEALKQMHIILDDEDEEKSSEDDVIELEAPPPKKKPKLHNKKTEKSTSEKSDVKTIPPEKEVQCFLDLSVTIEDLAPVQKSRLELQTKEEKEVETKLEQLLRIPNTEVIFNGVCTTAVQITEQLQSIINSASKTNGIAGQPTTKVQLQSTQSGLVLQPTQTTPGNNAVPQSYQLVMDPRLGVIVGTVAGAGPSTPPLLYHQTKVTQVTPTNNNAIEAPRIKIRKGVTMKSVTNNPTPVTPINTTPKVTVTKGGIQVKSNLTKTSTPILSNALNKSITVTKGKQNTPVVPPTQPNFKPTESNVEGGLTLGKPAKTIDLTTEDGRNIPDSREVSFNKLQGRTYPSLVVVARPHLRVKDLAGDRGKLDLKVKGVLMYPPTKFTEWLIQQGLIRSEQKCSVHPANSLKLGMYSDATKFPYSGGYVWISECCPQRFVSVFSGSLFEGSQHPPMAILKLLYHWCCQTIVQNVTQWVKVDNLFVKTMYTWLRAVCTGAIHTHVKQLGGVGVKVQIGVISLGTTSQDGNKREVKVEVLGILENTTRHIRLRAVEPLADGEKNYKKRFSKILEPVQNWVHPASTIVTDLTVDKTTLNQMGFANVIQSTSTDYSNSNRTIMEYLRRIVPRMFQNTLSLLSRQIIQQFLDELVWREWFGVTVLQSFDNMMQHIAEQTRSDMSQSLLARLSKVSANPFKTWSVKLVSPNTKAPVAPPPATPIPEVSVAKRSNRAQRKPITSNQEMARPVKSTSPDFPEQMIPLENYYYGTIPMVGAAKPKVTINIKCPFCKLNFSTNLALMNHLFRHAQNIKDDEHLCKYCLTIVPTASDLVKHIGSSHLDETKFDNCFVCLICELRVRNPFILGKHLSREHCPSELPYLCGTCSYRCSNHKEIIDHFYTQHENGNTIQCPFCLKSTTIHVDGKNITQNLNFFVQHLQKHQKKQLAKKCGRCVLWFIQKEVLKEHQTKMHLSQRGKHGLVQRVAPRNGVMVPKSKMDKCPNDDRVINFSTLHFNVGKTMACKECAQPLSNSKHIVSFQSCQNSNCHYSTCCSTAMQEHADKCKSSSVTLPVQKLPYEMYCICGFSETCGNQMARHLALCERKSAYPSAQSANSATVTHSMLDVLGLVRKPDESKEPSPPVSTEEESEQPAKEPSKETPVPSSDEMPEEVTKDDADEVLIESDTEKNEETGIQEEEKTETEQINTIDDIEKDDEPDMSTSREGEEEKNPLEESVDSEPKSQENEETPETNNSDTLANDSSAELPFNTDDSQISDLASKAIADLEMSSADDDVVKESADFPVDSTVDSFVAALAESTSALDVAKSIEQLSSVEEYLGMDGENAEGTIAESFSNNEKDLCTMDTD